MKTATEVRTEPAIVRGFRFAGVSAGLKSQAGAKDLGLIAAEHPVAAAGVFTANRIKAAPVILASQRVRRGRLRAVVVNSGSANCFTGKAGVKLARQSSEAAARALDCAAAMVAPCSTGVIGHLYDLEKYRSGVDEAAVALSDNGLEDFARAIMTTDTRPKIASISLELGGAAITIAGVAKGSGMIAPNMATMLSFIMTDAVVAPGVLRRALRRAVAPSFNAITIDGDMSTNDTVLILAGGAAKNRAFSPRDSAAFEDAAGDLAGSLARQLVHDGEGATKLVALEVRGARTARDAARIARQIANSPLVKTAFFGCDPNVGRILAAAGACGAAIDPERLELSLGGIVIAARGALLIDALPAAGDLMRGREFQVVLDLKLGRHSMAMLTSDLSFDYVKINAEYTT
ncbi:MAG: bifunctional glutamate N-acetyltransferase/amino-acid acetyltransferase ArgJ [Candidatus Binataceae bacterium]